jgi:VWFA-related protein
MRFLLFFVACLLCRDSMGGREQNREAARPAAPFQFEARVHEVLVPLVVLDGAGHAVGNLHKQDFQVFDKGKRQVISGFTLQMTGGNVLAADALGTPEPDRAAVSGKSTASESVASRRYIAILFDDLHADRGNLVQVRTGIHRMLAKSLKSSDMVAILSTSGRINTGFTRDQGRLQEAISSLRSFTHPRADCPDIDHYEAYLIIHVHDPQALDVVAQGGEQCRPPTPDKRMNEGVAKAAAASEFPIGEQLTTATLDVIREVARQMGSLPGQRVLVLISSGFIALTPAAEQAKSRAIEMAAQSNVSVSALDARGLYTEMEDERKLLPSMELDQFVQHSRIAHGQALAQLADGTGGTYFHNSNDFEGGLRKLIIAPEFRYLLRFSPNSKQDGTFHPIKVKVNKKGVRIFARRGYFAAIEANTHR